MDEVNRDNIPHEVELAIVLDTAAALLLRVVRASMTPEAEPEEAAPAEDDKTTTISPFLDRDQHEATGS